MAVYKNLKRDLYYSIDSWSGVHRNVSTAFGLIWLFYDSFRIQNNMLCKRREKVQLEIVTFSITPQLVFLALKLFEKYAQKYAIRFTIVDSSGNLRNPIHPQTQRYFFVNHHHWYKMDVFIQRVCHADIVVFCDDDVFLLNDEPIKYVLNEIIEKNVPVVSLAPRRGFKWPIENREYKPMGSRCLAVNREFWLNNNLFFRRIHKNSPSPNSWRGIFDTADFANVELIKRGIPVTIAPQTFQNEQIAEFVGVSRGLRKMRGDPSFTELDRRYLSMYRDISFFSELSKLLSKFPNLPYKSEIVDKEILQKYLQRCVKHLSEEEMKLKKEEIEGNMQKLTQALFPG